MMSLTACAVLVTLALVAGFIIGALVHATIRDLEDQEASDREAVGLRGEVQGAGVHDDAGYQRGAAR